MKPTIHLIAVSEPLLGFHNLVMVCGQVLNQAEIIWMVRDDYREESGFTAELGQMCKKCYPAVEDGVPLDDPGPDSKVRTYYYACIEGAEARPPQP